MTGYAALPQDQKIFSIRKLKDYGLSLYKIGRLVDNGSLVKLNKGYYENAEYAGKELDFYTWALMSRRA